MLVQTFPRHQKFWAVVAACYNYQPALDGERKDSHKLPWKKALFGSRIGPCRRLLNDTSHQYQNVDRQTCCLFNVIKE